MARALEIPVCRRFTDDEHRQKPNIPAEAIPNLAVRSKHDREFQALTKLLSCMNEKDRGILLHMASQLANRA